MAIQKRVKNGKVFYEATVSFGKNPKTGRQIRKYKNFPRKSDAVKWVSEQEGLKTKSSGQSFETRKMPFEYHMETYLKELQCHVSDNTLRTYEQIFNKWILPYFENIRIDEIDKSAIRNFRDYMQRCGGSAKNMNFVLNRLSSFLDFLRDEKVVDSNPIGKMKKMRIENKGEKGVKYHSPDDLNKLLKYASDKYYYDFLILLYNTGLRISEAAALRVRDVDIRNNTIKIRNNLQIYKPRINEPELKAYYMGSLKGNESRTLTLSDTVLKIIHKWIRNKKGTDFIFTTEKGNENTIIIERGVKPKITTARTIDSQNFTSNIFRPMQIRAGLSEDSILGVHGTRHTFAVRYMEAGGTLLDLKFELGHKSIKTTEIYAQYGVDHEDRKRNLVNIEAEAKSDKKTVLFKRVLKQS